MSNTDFIAVPTPLYQVVGGKIYRLVPETEARQVSMSDGMDVETRIHTLERALEANATADSLRDVEFVTTAGPVPENLRDGGLLGVINEDSGGGCDCGCDCC